MVFIPVSDLGRARSFYVDVLGLLAKEETPFALVLDAGGMAVRLTQVNDLRPQPFTVAGWQVPDIGSAIEILVSRGVTFIHYDGMEQDANGVWTLPSGDQVAWFKDPDDNTLSLTCFAGE